MKIIFFLLSFMYRYNDSLKVYVPEGTVSSTTKSDEPIEQIGKCVIVISREDIEKNGDITVFEALRNFPGLHVIPRGSFGGVTEVRLRGGKSGYVLVLIDGIKVNNPVSTDRNFDWGTLSTSAVERIEIIRGPQCSLYGNDAISGVINIITKKGQNGMKIDGALRANPYNTFSEQAGISGGTKKFDYSFSIFNINSQGLSKALAPDSQPALEKDGYNNREVYTKLNTYPFSNLSIGLTMGYRDSEVDVDAGPFKDDSNAINFFTSEYGNLFMNHKLTGLWNYKISVTVNRVEGKSEDTFDMIDTTEKTGSSEGEYIHSEWQNNFTVSKHLQIIAGIEHSQESGQSCKCSRDPHRQSLNYLPHSSLSNRSAYIELMPNYRNIFFNFSGRIDNYKDWSVTQSWDTPKYFGSYRTWQAGMTFLVNSTKFKGNYGIGFKMPSLYQLFSLLYGNTDLTPETNHSWDVGGEHRFKDGVVEITYYNQHIANSIDLIDKYPNRGYTNRGIGSEWCTEGIEIYFLLYILKDLSTDISFTGLDKVNAPEDYLLLPSLDYRWGVTYKWLNVKFCCIGKRQDNDYTSDLPQLADVRSCSKINLTDSFKFKRIKIQIKIENLIDDRSMESAGYTAPGRGFCIGISY